MSQKWQVIRSDGSRLGPLTALEIRDALRAGAIDPFDRVGLVGSKMTRPLVDVDEIFLAAAAGAKGKVDSVYEEPAEEHTRVAGRVPAAVGGAGGWVPPQLANENRATKKADPQPVVNPKNRMDAAPRNQQAYPKKNAKKYYLVDRQRRYHGPLSARDIQALFYRGLVEKGSSVARDRNGNLLPVDKFIKAYLGAKAGDFNSGQTRYNTSITRGLPSTRALEQRARELMQLRFFATLQKRSQQLPLYIGLTLAALCLAALVIFKALHPSVPRAPANADTLNSAPHAKSVTTPLDNSDTLNEATEDGDGSTSEVGDEDGGAVSISPRPQTRNIAAEKAARSKKAKKSSDRKKRTKSRTDYARPRQAWPPPPPRQVSAQVAPPRPGTLPRPPSSGGNWVAGAQVNLRGSFAMVALSRCATKCVLPFRTNTGQNIELIFFRDSYKADLNRTRGRGAIKGRVASTSPTIRVYLEEVTSANP